MENHLKSCIEKGFKAKTLTTKWTLDCLTGNGKGNFLVTPLCELLLLAEIKAWLRIDYMIHIEMLCEPEIVNDMVGEMYYRTFIWQEGKPKPEVHHDIGSQKYEVILLETLKQAVGFI